MEIVAKEELNNLIEMGPLNEIYVSGAVSASGVVGVLLALLKPFIKYFYKEQEEANQIFYYFVARNILLSERVSKLQEKLNNIVEAGKE